jgi:hypothetical protein
MITNLILHRTQQDKQKLVATSVPVVWRTETASNLPVCLDNYVFVFVTKPPSVSVILPVIFQIETKYDNPLSCLHAPTVFYFLL